MRGNLVALTSRICQIVLGEVLPSLSFSLSLSLSLSRALFSLCLSFCRARALSLFSLCLSFCRARALSLSVSHLPDGLGRGDSMCVCVCVCVCARARLSRGGDRSSVSGHVLNPTKCNRNSRGDSRQSSWKWAAQFQCVSIPGELPMNLQRSLFQGFS